VINKDTNVVNGKKQLYKDKHAKNNEQMAKIAVLNNKELSDNYFRIPNTNDSNGPEMALVTKGTMLFDLLLKNAGLHKLNISDTPLNGRVSVPVESIEKLLRNIEKTRNESFNFINIQNYVVSIVRTDNEKFDDPTNTSAQQYKNHANYDECMNHRCTISFDVDIEFMAAVQDNTNKSGFKSGTSSPQFEDKNERMRLGSGN
jgi:hypothetical protein